MKQSKQSQLFYTIFFIFLTYKVFGISGVDSWSWYMVASPLWLPFALYLPLYYHRKRVMSKIKKIESELTQMQDAK